MHVSLTTVTRVRFWLQTCSYLMKVRKTIIESVVQLDSAKLRRFSPGTPVSSCANNGPMRSGPY